MCTLSFIPKSGGYLVAMNRDELLSRGVAQPPTVRVLSGIQAVFPTDVEGGTWLAATEVGDTWALLNRNGGRRSPRNSSRGQIILGAIAAEDPERIDGLLSEVGLFNFLPFRLFHVGLFRRVVREWVWDGETLNCTPHRWQANHWFSSGVSDQRAAERRRKYFEAGWSQRDAGQVEWLRTMHRSHGEEPGAFSVCVHREDAATVSYTEIDAGEAAVEMQYRAGSPCREGTFETISLARSRAFHSL